VQSFMKNKNQPAGAGDRTEVSLLAYQMWIDAGRPEGQDQKFWFEAETRIRAVAKPTAAPPPPATALASAASKTNTTPKNPNVQINPVVSQANQPKPGQKFRKA